MLTARAGGTVDLHLHVLGPDVHLCCLHLRQNGHGGRGGVDASAGFGLRHALDPVDAGFKFHPGVGARSVDHEVGLLHAAKLGLAVVQQLNRPALGGSVHRVHPEQAVGKQGALLAADAAADLHDDVLPVVGVLGQEQDAELVLQCLALLLGGLILVLQKLLHFGLLAHHGQRLVHRGPGLLPGAEGLHHGLQLPLLAQIPCRQLRVRVKIRLLASGAELVVFVFQKGQFFFHARFLYRVLPPHAGRTYIIS